MDMDASMRGRGGFPVDQPIEALKADHHYLRQLFDRYFQTQDADEKKDAGTHILLLLEMHTALEEGVFYPRVRAAAPALLDRCEQEHEHAGALTARLKTMDETDPQAVQLFHELAEVIFRHIDTEEQQVFPTVLQANLDWDAIGQAMLALETRMAAGRAHRPAPGLRQ